MLFVHTRLMLHGPLQPWLGACRHPGKSKSEDAAQEPAAMTVQFGAQSPGGLLA